MKKTTKTPPKMLTPTKTRLDRIKETADVSTLTRACCLLAGVEEKSELKKYDESLMNPHTQTAGPVLKELLERILTETSEIRVALDRLANEKVY